MTVPAAQAAARIAKAVLAPLRRAMMPVVKAIFRARRRPARAPVTAMDAETEMMT